MSVPTAPPVSTGDVPASARAGQEIGGYRLGFELASGGMGVVYRARRLHPDGAEDGDEVAIKLLRRADGGDAERRRRFVREGRVVAALDHPGIVRVRAIGDEGGELYIVMDLVAGKSLREWLTDVRASDRTPDVAACLRIARGIADAVAYAHGKGVVHRDLKPDNVMVDADGNVRVLDFGLAKMREIDGGAVYEAETETSLTHEGRVLGTPGYMAPEQASGKEVGFRADVFALGAILHELLTGARAFTGGSPMDVLVALARDNPDAPSKRNPGVGPGLDALVARCLAKNPRERPSMEEVARELSSPRLLSESASRSKASHRKVVGGVLLAVLACVGMLGVRLARRSTATGAPPPSAASAASVVPTAVTDLPAPVSTVAAALATYKSALADERDGAEDAALEELDRATEQDPDFAAAHLRLALRLAYTEAERAHVHFAKAVQLRERLSERDRELVAVAQRVLQRDPADKQGWVDGLRELVAKRPGDAELLYELASALNILGRFEEEVETGERAVALDPAFGLARAELAQAQAYLGHFDAARATVAECTKRLPNATWCMWVTEFIDGADGRCSDESARARLAVDPSQWSSYLELYYALTATGDATAGAEEAIQQVASRIHDPFRSKRMRLNLTLRLDELRGDFAAAMTHADELRAHIATSSDTSTRAGAAIVSAEIAVETGQPRLAGTFGKDFLERRQVWQSPPIAHDYSVSDDALPQLAAFAYHGGTMPQADYTRELDDWRGRWDALLQGDYRPYLWVYGYAGIVQTREEALEAMSALPRYAPIPPFIPNGYLPQAGVGRTLWLAGREDDGLVYLDRAAHQCGAGVHPIPWVRAHAWLAEALAKRGDVDGACRENDVVLARWGSARPRSVTAEGARTLARTLGCKPSDAGQARSSDRMK